MADLVAQLRRGFVVLVRDSFAQVALQLFELRFPLERSCETGRFFSEVRGSFVHPLKERLQTFSKSLVAIAAAESTGLFKVGLAKATNRTLLHGTPALHFLRRAKAQQEVGKRKACWVSDAFLFRTAFAQVYLLHLAFNDLGKKDRSLILFANIAIHGGREAGEANQS
jgi:hypothetical protein